MTVNPTLLTIAAGVSGTYQVRLETEPSDTVTVMVDSPTKDVTVDPKLLIFTPQNWNRNQTVTVTVDEDAGGTERKSVTLTHQASGGDYAGWTSRTSPWPSRWRALRANRGDCRRPPGISASHEVERTVQRRRIRDHSVRIPLP